MSGGRRWFEQDRGFQARPRSPQDPETPEVFVKCAGCGAALFIETLAKHHHVCPECGHHARISALERLDLLVDEGSITTWHDTEIASIDALGFVDSKPYPKRLAAAQSKTGRREGFLAVSATIGGVDVEAGTMDFAFLGGSMGSAVGEAITRLFERATQRRVPAVVVSASGGARMQEGALSLMQMAKTSAAVARLRDEAKMPYVSVLTHPTTGGVAASFSMLGDLIIAEPGSLVGFAGPRVIKETIGQELPEGFQTAEYLLDHGAIDLVIARDDLRPTIGQLLRQLVGAPARA